MQFITTGNRIAVENFVLGDLYTITFTNGTYINSACIGIGNNFVTFQRNEPELLFSLTMATAELVSSIELYAGSSGTNNYNDLTNKPQINEVELVGNKSLSDLGIQATISDIDTIRSGAAAGATAVQPAALSDYQPLISDLDTIRAGAAAGATAVQPADMTSALALKQDALSTAQLTAVNSGITSTDVAQITTNKNNILSEQAKTTGMGTGGSNYIQVNGIKMYFDTTAPTGASVGDVWITGTGSIKCKSENLLDFSAWANGVAVIRGTMTVNSDSVSITSTAATCFTGWNTTEYPESARITVTAGDVIQFTWECDVNDNSNVWIFPNASATGNVSVSATTKFLQYTVPDGVNYITFRLDVATADKTFTYSNLSIAAWK